MNRRIQNELKEIIKKHRITNYQELKKQCKDNDELCEAIQEEEIIDWLAWYIGN